MNRGERIIEGRHLLYFECAACGPCGHGQALEVMGEVLLCWSCVCGMALGERAKDESNECPMCYPATCPADGAVFLTGDENREHIRLFHGKGEGLHYGG